LIIAIPQGMSEPYYAIHVILLWDCCKMILGALSGYLDTYRAFNNPL